EKCLDVRGGLLENGTPVQLYDCNDSPAQNWVYHRGTGQVRVKGTNFCLDSGSGKCGQRFPMKIWQCFDNLPAQTWTLTWDDRLVRAGTGLCLDLTNGSRVNGNIIQTWTCPTSTQIRFGCPGAFDFGPSAPNYQGYEPPILPTDPALLRNNWNDKCLDVRGGVFQNGTPVQIYDCTTSPQQYWVYHRGIGQVRVKGTNFCLDSGLNATSEDPINGSQMKIWECYENLPAQTWFRTWDSRLVRAGTSLCLDLTNGSLANGNIIQTWTCSDLNRNQNWHKSVCPGCFDV
ncbi:carbohydrate-binding module family 13 protein/putative endo-1,3-beta-glucanase, partial [Coprinopsis sp. MPI-PUGE-AT-0042]